MLILHSLLFVNTSDVGDIGLDDHIGDSKQRSDGAIPGKEPGGRLYNRPGPSRDLGGQRAATSTGNSHVV